MTTFNADINSAGNGWIQVTISGETANTLTEAQIVSSLSTLPIAAEGKELTEFQSGQWWLEELEKHWGTGETTPQTRRAAKVALSFAEAYFGPSSPGKDGGQEVEAVKPSIDTMREAAWALLRKFGWQPTTRLSLHQVSEVMAAFGMNVSRGEVGCGYPDCGCCADAACEDAIKQHADFRTQTASTALVEAAHDLISDWLQEGVEDLPDDTPVNVNIGGRLIIHNKLGELRAALSRSAEGGKPVVTANCCHCGRIIDTREISEGGDAFGAEMSDGRWTCSFECNDAVLGLCALSTPADSEPVAWRARDEKDSEKYWHYFTKEPRQKAPNEIWEPLYAAPVADREPVSVPDGWVLVPLQANWHALENLRELMDQETDFEVVSDAYRYVIDALPSYEPDEEDAPIAPATPTFVGTVQINPGTNLPYGHLPYHEKVKQGDALYIAAAPQPNPSKVAEGPTDV